MFGLTQRNLGQYFALDARTGKLLWTSDGRQATNIAMLRAGNVLFSLEVDGELVVMRTSRTGFEPLHRYQVAEAETWTQPGHLRQPDLRQGRVDPHALDAELTQTLTQAG